jgi:hypothetical protein
LRITRTALIGLALLVVSPGGTFAAENSPDGEIRDVRKFECRPGAREVVVKFTVQNEGRAGTFDIYFQGNQFKDGNDAGGIRVFFARDLDIAKNEKVTIDDILEIDANVDEIIGSVKIRQSNKHNRRDKEEVEDEC